MFIQFQIEALKNRALVTQNKTAGLIKKARKPLGSVDLREESQRSRRAVSSVPSSASVIISAQVVGGSNVFLGSSVAACCGRQKLTILVQSKARKNDHTAIAERYPRTNGIMLKQTQKIAHGKRPTTTSFQKSTTRLRSRTFMSVRL